MILVTLVLEIRSTHDDDVVVVAVDDDVDVVSLFTLSL